MTDTAAQTLAVQDWDSYVGQPLLKERLDVHVAAALHDERPLEHVLLTGPLGSGKTSMARLIAARCHDPILELTMPMDRKTLIREFDNWTGGVLFLDEIHAQRDQEMLLPLLTEGFLLDSRGQKHQRKWLTVVAATTERDKVIRTLSSRFAITPEFEPYSDGELGLIVARMAAQAEVDLDQETAMALGRASGGIPRNAEHLVLAARALGVSGRPVSTETILEFCQTDPDGLTVLHKRHLDVLHSQGDQASEKTLATLLDLSGTAVRDLERLPLQKGYIVYTPTGRQLTATGRAKQAGREAREYQRR